MPVEHTPVPVFTLKSWKILFTILDWIFVKCIWGHKFMWNHCYDFNSWLENIIFICLFVFLYVTPKFLEVPPLWLYSFQMILHASGMLLSVIFQFFYALVFFSYVFVSLPVGFLTLPVDHVRITCCHHTMRSRVCVSSCNEFLPKSILSKLLGQKFSFSDIFILRESRIFVSFIGYSTLINFSKLSKL